MKTRRGAINDHDDESDAGPDDASHEDSQKNSDNDDDDDDERNTNDESDDSGDSDGDEGYRTDDEEADDEEEYETDDEEEEFKLIQTKSLLFLCQEGQIRLARCRLQLLQHQYLNHNLDIQLQKEIFQIGPADKNYSLHEIVMGGTKEESSSKIIPELLEIAEQWKGQCLVMMNAQPPSHGRTALHWAAWGNASLEILRLLVTANPEALLLKDNKSHGERTPLQVWQRYHGSSFTQSALKDDCNWDKFAFLSNTTRLWTQQRLRLAIYKAALHWFRRHEPCLLPFDKKGRKETRTTPKNCMITPKNWFVLSVLGYCLQREMEPLMWRILGFVGGKAQVDTPSKRKRRRSRGVR
ncbi:MAG: hypothetical protein SGBAC_008020 [Bacillariaceae sp.]